MKKLLILLLVVMLAVCLVACGGDDTTTNDASTTTQGQGNTNPPTSSGTSTTTQPAGSSAAVTTKPSTPDTAEKTLVLDPSNFNKVSSIVLNNVVENTNYPNEFTFKKGGSSMSSTEIKGITKIVAYVFGTYDNFKMYQGTSNAGTLITPTVKDVPASNGKTDKEYTYTFVGGTDAFYLENPSDYTVNPFSITIYYTGAAVGGSTGGDTDNTTSKPNTPVEPGKVSTIEEILTVGSGLAEGGETSETYTVTGVVTSVSSAEVDITADGKTLKCYFGSKGSGENLYMGYTVTLTGNIKNYYGVIELVNFAVNDYTAVTYTVTLEDAVNGSVSASKTTGLNWGEQITITVTPSAGYELDALKINGLKVSVTNGSATVTVEANTTVEATFVKEGEAAKDLATFDFGANVSAGEHADGEAVEGSFTATDGSYTLTLGNIVKLFQGAYDAKGTSALKLGTSKAVGGFTLTAPEGVEKVVFWVAMYKAKSTKVVINGQEYTIETLSDNGAYTPIEIDVSTNKTITFSTASGANRCMIDKIVFQG